MTLAFSVRTTTHFDRVFKKLARRQPELPVRLASVASILETDPYNRTRAHPIKKLENVPAGKGQYRIRSGRFRFRYDVEKQTVYLVACALRREDTY